MYVPCSRSGAPFGFGSAGAGGGARPSRAGIARPAGWIRSSHPMVGPVRGVGQASLSSPQTINQIATTGAATTVSILVALGTVTGPVGAAIAGLVAVGSLLASVFKGCGSTCTEATSIANQVEQALQQNLSTYMSAPVHYASAQAAALNNFQTAWNALTQACGNPQLLSAGTNCISERQQGACSYKTSPGGWQQNSAGAWAYVPPGANNSGSSCWNWWIGYHDPIANDPTVVPDPSPVSASSPIGASVGGVVNTIGSAVSSLSSGTLFGIPISNLLLPAAVLIAILALTD